MKKKYVATIITMNDDEAKAFLPFGIVIETRGGSQTETKFVCNLDATEYNRVIQLPGLITLKPA